MADYFSDIPVGNEDAQNTAQVSERNAAWLREALDQLQSEESNILEGENIGDNPEKDYLSEKSQQRMRGGVGSSREIGLDEAIREDIQSRYGADPSMDYNRQYPGDPSMQEAVDEYRREHGEFGPKGREERKAARDKYYEDQRYFEQAKQDEANAANYMTSAGVDLSSMRYGGGGGGGRDYANPTPQRATDDPNAGMSWQDYAEAYQSLSAGKQEAFRRNPWDLSGGQQRGGGGGGGDESQGTSGGAGGGGDIYQFGSQGTGSSTDLNQYDPTWNYVNPSNVFNAPEEPPQSVTENWDYSDIGDLYA